MIHVSHEATVKEVGGYIGNFATTIETEGRIDGDKVVIATDALVDILGWEIKDGKLGKMVKNPTYTGITPQFWGQLDMLAGESLHTGKVGKSLQDVKYWASISNRRSADDRL